MILRTFRNHDRENHRTILGAFLARILDLHIDIAVVLVPLTDLVQILFQLHFIQPSGLIEKVNERFAPRLHLFAQDLLAKMLVSLKMDLAHSPF